MRRFRELGTEQLTDEPVVVAVGCFDGVHLGHQFLIRTARQIATEQHTLVAAITITPELGGGGENLLMSSFERRQLFESMGVDLLFELQLTFSLKLLSAREFIRTLAQMFPIHTWVGGSDMSFGHNREGTAVLLKQLGSEYGFQTLFIDRLCLQGEEISSTRIRRFVEAGDIDRASLFLGRPYVHPSLHKCTDPVF